MSTQFIVSEANSEFTKNFSKNIAKFIPWLFENYQVKNVCTGLEASITDVNISNFAEPKRKKMESLFKFFIDSDFTFWKNEKLVENENEVISDFNNAPKKARKSKKNIEQADQADQVEQADQADQVENVTPKKPRKSKKNVDQADQVENVTPKKPKIVKPKKVKSNQADQADQADQSNQADQADKAEIEKLNVDLNILFGNPLKTETEYRNEWKIQIGNDIFTIYESKNENVNFSNESKTSKFFTVYIEKSTIVNSKKIEPKEIRQTNTEELFGEENCCEEEIEQTCTENCEEEIESKEIKQINTEELFGEEEELGEEINLDDIEF